MNKIKEYIKKIDTKTKIITIISVIIVVIILTLMLVLTRRNKQVSEDDIYGVFPSEVRQIYSNLVNISCSGDLYFDIELDGDEIDVNNINKIDLLNYIFSYLDKKDFLKNKFSVDVLKDAANRLFLDNIDVLVNFTNFNYGKYTYTLKNNQIIRTSNECISNNNYVSYLYGYSWSDDILKIDVNIGYLKDGILYDFDDNELGEYDGDKSKLANLMKNVSYYRMTYIKDNGVYKFKSIKWMNRV